jgi:uncharacterized protein (DUF302 family)
MVTTVERLLAAVTANGMTVVARIDHMAAAAEAGIPLRPTEVFIFGNPRVGTPLMQAAPTLAIDLPLRALVWRDAFEVTWLSYNDPIWVGARHGLTPEQYSVLWRMADALRLISATATTATEPASGASVGGESS